MEIAFVVLVIVLVAVWASPRVRQAKHSIEGAYAKKPSVLTPAEQTFLGALEKVVGNRYRIFCQVRAADVISSANASAFNRVQSKSFDFVLCDLQTAEALLVIELNDRTHERPDRMDRDRFLSDLCQSIGLPIIFQKVQFSYDVFELQGRIASAMGLFSNQSFGVNTEDALPHGDIGMSDVFVSRRTLKIVLAAAPLILIAILIYGGAKVIPHTVTSGAQTMLEIGKKQTDKARAQVEAARRQQLANQLRQAQETAATQRDQAARDMAALQIEQEKEKAWQNYYHPSAKCENATDWNVTVECGNEHIRAKREFEEKWRAEH